ncbi:MAG: MFS transporter [Halodesulfurarchaeum sp.]
MNGAERSIWERLHRFGSAVRTPEHAVWILVASSTLTVMAGAVLGPVVNQIQAALGVSQSLAGLIITTHGLFIVVMSPIAGVLIDRFGPRRPLIFGLGLYGITGGAGLVIETVPLLLLSRAGLGIAVAFVYTSVTVLIYNLYEGERKNRVMGFRGSANSMGAAIWPLLGGLLGTLSWHGPFGIYLLALPLGALAVVLVPEPATKRLERSGGVRATVRSLVGIIRDTPLLIPVYGLYFLTNVLLYSIVVYYPGLLATIGLTSSISISLYLSAMGVSGGVSAFFYDRIKRRFTHQQLAVVAFALWSVGFGLATVVSSSLTAAAPVMLFGLGQGLVFPTVLLWIEELVPPDRQGQFSSYVAMLGYLGQFLSPVVFGPIASRFGPSGVFGGAFVLVVVGLLTAAIGVTGNDWSTTPP